MVLEKGKQACFAESGSDGCCLADLVDYSGTPSPFADGLSMGIRAGRVRPVRGARQTPACAASMAIPAGAYVYAECAHRIPQLQPVPTHTSCIIGGCRKDLTAMRAHARTLDILNVTDRDGELAQFCKF